MNVGTYIPRHLCSSQEIAPGIRCYTSVSVFMWVLRDLNTGPFTLGVNAWPLSPLPRPHWSSVSCGLASEEMFSWSLRVFENYLLFWFLKKCLIVHKIPRSPLFLIEVFIAPLSSNSSYCLMLIAARFQPAFLFWLTWSCCTGETPS